MSVLCFSCTSLVRKIKTAAVVEQEAESADLVLFKCTWVKLILTRFSL